MFCVAIWSTTEKSTSTPSATTRTCFLHLFSSNSLSSRGSNGDACSHPDRPIIHPNFELSRFASRSAARQTTCCWASRAACAYPWPAPAGGDLGEQQHKQQTNKQLEQETAQHTRAGRRPLQGTSLVNLNVPHAASIAEAWPHLTFTSHVPSSDANPAVYGSPEPSMLACLASLRLFNQLRHCSPCLCLPRPVAPKPQASQSAT